MLNYVQCQVYVGLHTTVLHVHGICCLGGKVVCGGLCMHDIITLTQKEFVTHKIFLCYDSMHSCLCA